MKTETPKEILKKYNYVITIDLGLAMEEYGRQCWNAALDAAAENADTKWGQSVVKVDKETILKLKK